MGRKTRNAVILALDPSGNFDEGKGTTGWVLGDSSGKLLDFGQIYAKNYSNQIIYWNMVIYLLRSHKPDIVICEGYRLYASAASSQINSQLETPQLIGVIKYFCHAYSIPIRIQLASEVKQRWNNDILEAKYGTEIFKKVPHHAKDALRHFTHYIEFKYARSIKPKPVKNKGDYSNYD